MKKKATKKATRKVAKKLIKTKAARKNRAAGARPAAEPCVLAPSRWIVATQREVAEFFGVSFDTVKTWHRNGAPKAGPKQYDLQQITRWLLDRRSTPAAGDEGSRAQQLTVRKLEAEVLAKERANLQAAGVLVDRRAIESQIGTLLIEARKTFARLPTRIQPAIPRELEGTLLPELKRILHAALHELADRMQAFEPDVD